MYIYIYIYIVADGKNFKLLFSAVIILPLEFRIYIFRPMKMTDAILPGRWPGQHKRLYIAPSTSSLPHLQTAGQTTLTRSACSLSLSYLGRFQQQTDGHFNTRECIQHCSSASFRRIFLINYFFLLNQLDLETSGWTLNSSSTIYNCCSYLRLTAQGFFLSQAVIKTSLLKTINILVNSFVLPLNITRGNRTQQPQLPFLYKW